MTSLNDRQIDLKGVYPMGIGSGSVHLRDARRKVPTQYTQPALFDNSPATLPG